MKNPPATEKSDWVVVPCVQDGRMLVVVPFYGVLALLTNE